MTIIDTTDKKIAFETIPVGYTFCYDKKVYMVFDNRHINGKNAVCLNNGDSLTFHRDAEVIPCEVRLEIIKKGSFA